MKKTCIQTKDSLCSLLSKQRRLKILSVALTAVFILTMFFNTQPVFAHASGGYSYEPGVETSHKEGMPWFDYSEWMTWLSDSACISELSIPGTHDTMANSSNFENGWLIAQCQSKTLKEQLESGIRAIDIRCMHYYESPKLLDWGIIGSSDELNMDKFAIYHGPMYQGKNFNDVLKDCRDFLADHPGETILMRVKEEKDAWEYIPETLPINGETIALKSEIEPRTTFSQTFERYKSEYPGLIWDPSEYQDVNGTKYVKVPELGEVRGKIVILDDFSKSDNLSEPYGLRWENNNWQKENIIMNVQDEYDPDRLYDKWEHVKNQMINTDSNENTGKIFINHLSANNPTAVGIDSEYEVPLPPLLPFFFASGHMTPATDSLRLLTGIHAEGNSDIFPDFPRIKETWKLNNTILSTSDHYETMGWGIIGDAVGGIGGAIGDIGDAIGDGIGDVFDGIGDMLGEAFGDLFGDLFGNLIGDLFGDLFGDFSNAEYTATFIYYEGINELVLNYLPEVGRTGIMMMDFPGPDLISSILSKNDSLIEYIKISTYKTEWTNQDITVNAETMPGWVLNRGSHTFTENGSFTFKASFSISIPYVGEIRIDYPKRVTITNIDKVAPVITITEPADNATYILGEQAYASWEAADYESGIATSNATLKNGEALDTSSVGTKTFSVTATDEAGNTSTKTVTYNVTYGFSGVMRPVKGDGTDTFKPGQTIPIKFGLTDTNDQHITDSVAEIYYAKVIEGVVGAETEAVGTRAANQGNVCAYDVKDNQYIYNLSTKGWDPGTYQVTIKLDDGTSHSFTVSSKTK